MGSVVALRGISCEYRRHLITRQIPSFSLEDAEVDEDEDEDDDADYGGDADDLFGVDPNERAEAERFLKEQEKLQERRRNKYA